MEGASRAVDKMENSIQNIILQEMETLEGIMIAKTNLTSNLDKPTVKARAEIWEAMLTGLDANDSKTLASSFDLSGGEIENIVRKHTVAAILLGNDAINIDALTETCHHERINKFGQSSIGF